MIAPRLVLEPLPDFAPAAPVEVGCADVLTPVMRAPSLPVLVKVTVTTGMVVGVVTEAELTEEGVVTAEEEGVVIEVGSLLLGVEVGVVGVVDVGVEVGVVVVEVEVGVVCEVLLVEVVEEELLEVVLVTLAGSVLEAGLVPS